MSSPALEFVRAAALFVAQLLLDGGHGAPAAGGDVTQLVLSAASQAPGRLLGIRVAALVVTPESTESSKERS